MQLRISYVNIELTYKERISIILFNKIKPKNFGQSYTIKVFLKGWGWKKKDIVITRSRIFNQEKNR